MKEVIDFASFVTIYRGAILKGEIRPNLNNRKLLRGA